MDTLLFPADKVPTYFCCQMLIGFFFPDLVLWFGDPCMGLRPQFPQGGTFAAMTFLWFLSPYPWCKSQPPLCLWPSYQSLQSFVQSSDIILQFRNFYCLVRLFALNFSCKSGLVWRGVCCFHLLCSQLGTCINMLCLHLMPKRPFNMFTEVKWEIISNYNINLKFSQFKAA